MECQPLRCSEGTWHSGRQEWIHIVLAPPHLSPAPVGLGLTAPSPCIPEVAKVTAGGLAGSGIREAPPSTRAVMRRKKPVGKNRFCVVSLGIDRLLFIPALFLLGTYPGPTALPHCCRHLRVPSPLGGRSGRGADPCPRFFSRAAGGPAHWGLLC